MNPQVECSHAGAIRRRSWDPREYCPVCWQIQIWAEWFDTLKDLPDDV